MSEFVIEGDKVIAKRKKAKLVSSVRAGAKRPEGAPIGQDGYSYLVQGSFHHPFTPYFSKRTQQYYDGCDTCGWSERIHGPKLTHIECESCLRETPIETIKTVKVDDDYGFHDIDISGKKHKFHTVIRQDRFFCSESCVDQWFKDHTP